MRKLMLGTCLCSTLLVGCQRYDSGVPCDNYAQRVIDGALTIGLSELGWKCTPRGKTLDDIVDETRAKAKDGDPEAQYGLGSLYRVGTGLPQDDGHAAYWFTQAANQGHARAQFTLGTVYSAGTGIMKNNTLAYVLFSLAAAGDEPKFFMKEALTKRDEVAEHMTPEQIVAAQKMASEWKPGSLPNPET